VLAFAIPDGHPVSDGHTLVAPRRPVGTGWEATRDERIAPLDLAEDIKHTWLEARLAPDGWDMGVNVGEAGGQTVPHLPCTSYRDTPVMSRIRAVVSATPCPVAATGSRPPVRGVRRAPLLRPASSRAFAVQGR
jgi:hypothetical protein